MSKIDINAEQVGAALSGVKFDIGGNTYGAMTSISSYVSSIYAAVASLKEGWNASYESVSEYAETVYGVPLPDINPEPESAFLNNVEGSLQNVNTFLNVRSGSGTENQAIGSLAAGMAFTVLGTGEVDSDGTLWYKVKYKNNEGEDVEGYVSSKYVKLNETPETETPSNAASENANTSSNISDDSSANNYSETPKDPSGGSNNSNGGNPGSSSTPRTNSSQNKKGATITLENSDLEFKDENGNVIKLGKGEQVTIINDDGESSMVKIKLSNGNIYSVNRSELNLAQKGSTIARVSLSHSNYRLNVRSTPNNDNNSNIVGLLNANDSVEVLGASENGWTKIKINGSEGYVASKYLKI